MAIWWAAVWVGLAGLYLLLAGQIDIVESAACLLCASIGTALVVQVDRIARHRMSGWPAPRGVLRPIAALVPETLAVGRQLLAAVFRFEARRGAYVRQPFDPGGDDPVSAARRAAVMIGVSMAPGSFVIRGERTDTMILHALPDRPASPDTKWPA